MIDIIEKIKKAEITGRSGCNFPVWKKWSLVKENLSEKHYIICNASEGELETFKDYYLLKNHSKEVIEGIKIALDTFQNSSAYIYLNKDYYSELKDLLEGLIDDRFVLFKKEGGYIGGEETAILEAIEGKRPEPRSKPPFPTKSGLWGYPTLINNVETFYSVYQIERGSYKKTRFYSISGKVKNKGVFEFHEETTIREILEKTRNAPDFDYFLQVGGGACGEIMLPEELDKKVKGLASIIVYDRKKTEPFLLMEKWAKFLFEGNCNKCTPCREGTYRILEIIKKKKMEEIDDIFFAMENSSFCPLGRVAVVPFQSLLNKIVNNNDKNNN